MRWGCVGEVLEMLSSCDGEGSNRPLRPRLNPVRIGLEWGKGILTGFKGGRKLLRCLFDPEQHSHVQHPRGVIPSRPLWVWTKKNVPRLAERRETE